MEVITQFAVLLGMIPRRFSISEVYADKGYYSIENYRLVEDKYGAVPFIDFKDTAKPVGDGPHDRALARYKSKLAPGRGFSHQPFALAKYPSTREKVTIARASPPYRR